MYSEICALARTSEEVKKITDELEAVNEALFQNNEQALAYALSKVSLKVQEVLKNAFDKSVNKEEFLLGSKEALKKLKTVSITIAFDPSESLVTKLSLWAKENFKEGVVFDISKNEAIVGGALIISEGYWRDFTLRDKIKHFFQNERQFLISQLTK